MNLYRSNAFTEKQFVRILTSLDILKNKPDASNSKLTTPIVKSHSLDVELY